MPAPTRRHALLGLALAGCALLVAAEFADLYAIRVHAVTVAHQSVGAHHGYALLVLALAAAVFAAGATLGGSRPAARGLAVLAVAALVVALAVDLPAIGRTGRYGEAFERARARGGVGFKLETAGALVLLVAAGGILVAGPRDGVPRERDRTGYQR